MAFSDFTLSDLKREFGVEHQRKALDFGTLTITPSQKLIEDLEESTDMPIKSEKARSEWVVVPILKELRRKNNKFFTVYSGEILNADKERGLIGECDFILSKDIRSFEISVPIFQIVEAKKNDLEEGVKQCAAQLIGARVFNEKNGIVSPVLYGCTTTGDNWLFLQLEDNLLTIDIQKYYLNEVDRICLEI